MAKSSSFLIAAITVAVFFLPSTVLGSRPIPTKFIVRGRVFCDTCQAGFETSASIYVAGAKVRVECRSRESGAETCKFDGVTDSSGTYKIQVADEHEHEICESVLVSSPDNGCSSPVMGRERARVFLTDNNGISSDVRIANALGFHKNTPLPICAQLMKTYLQEVEVVV